MFSFRCPFYGSTVTLIMSTQNFVNLKKASTTCNCFDFLTFSIYLLQAKSPASYHQYLHILFPLRSHHFSGFLFHCAKVVLFFVFLQTVFFCLFEARNNRVNAKFFFFYFNVNIFYHFYCLTEYKKWARLLHWKLLHDFNVRKIALFRVVSKL